VKLGMDTLSTVPEAPPAAGPDRALDPPRADTCCPDVAGADVAVAALAVLLLEPELAIA
jgi:hypothetical protein